MRHTERVKQLRKILGKQITWYERQIKKQGEDFVYYRVQSQFAQLSADQLLAILALLV